MGVRSEKIYILNKLIYTWHMAGNCSFFSQRKKDSKLSQKLICLIFSYKQPSVCRYNIKGLFFIRDCGTILYNLD